MRIALIALCTFCLVSCDSLTDYAIDLPLDWVNSPDLKYRDTLVTVCGFATNAFEDVQITETREGDWRQTSAGLGVKWLMIEPSIKTAEQRCVTGMLEPTGGWEFYDLKAAGETDEIIVSTGHGHDWVIVQTSLKRD